MNRWITLLILVFFTTIAVYSQTQNIRNQNPSNNLSSEEQKIYDNLINRPLNGFFGITFTNCVPQNDLYQNLRRSGQGFSIYGGYRADPAPISLGGQVDFLFFGGDDKIFSYQNQGGWTQFRDTVSYQNMIIPIGVFFRIEPNMGRIFFPYIQGNLGFTLYSASADFKPSYGETDSKNELDAAWHWGGAIGTQIKLVDFVNLPTSYSRMLLDIGFKYLYGTTSNYYEITRIDDNTAPIFKKHRSQTDMLLFQIGLVFHF